MVSVERPSEIGTPQWNGPQQRKLPFALNTVEVDEYREKGFLILRDVFQPTEIETYRQEAEQIVERAFALSREFQLEPEYNLRFEMLADGQPWKIDPSDTSRSHARSGTSEVLLSLAQFDTPHIPDFSHP